MLRAALGNEYNRNVLFLFQEFDQLGLWKEFARTHSSQGNKQDRWDAEVNKIKWYLRNLQFLTPGEIGKAHKQLQATKNKQVC